MLKFYNSEVGKKMVKNLPAIFGETLNASKKWVQNSKTFIQQTLTKDGFLKNPPPKSASVQQTAVKQY